MPEIKTKLNLDLVIESLKISKSTTHFLLIWNADPEYFTSWSKQISATLFVYIHFCIHGETWVSSIIHCDA